jgi:hypothetical protein
MIDHVMDLAPRLLCAAVGCTSPLAHVSALPYRLVRHPIHRRVPRAL